MPQQSQEPDDASQDDDQELQMNRLSVSLRLALGRRKKKRGDALDPYRRFVAFYTRSENPFVNYYSVLDAGMAWETFQFGDLSRDEFCAENAKLLHVYGKLRSGVPQFTQDFYELRRESEELEVLQKQLNDVVTSARGADIHSLREKGIAYIELEQPDKELNPRIDPGGPKSTVRGYNHLVLSRLLCPVKYLADFDANPAEFQIKLRNNKVRVVAGDFSALLYPHGGYDPDDLESGLFRNPILLRFYKHIFTAPSSARQELTSTGSRPKIKRLQAMLNGMKAVTPGSIAYAALMFRHCIGSLDDWRTEDNLFNREDFFDSIVSFLDDPDDEWAKDTLKWWNIHIFGDRYITSDDEQDQEPSTADLLRVKRAARKREAQQTTSERTNQLVSSTGKKSASSTNHHDLSDTPHPEQSPRQGYGQHNPVPYRPYCPEDSTIQHPRPDHQYHQPPLNPLGPHDSNVPRHLDRYSSPPARNRDRSRSPPHLQTRPPRYDLGRLYRR